MESGEMVSALVEKIRPDCVVAVDAAGIQKLGPGLLYRAAWPDTGIVPVAGVGICPAALNAETLGVPVVAVGVPTVVDAATLALDVLSEAGREDLDPEVLRGAGKGLIVTPRTLMRKWLTSRRS